MDKSIESLMTGEENPDGIRFRRRLVDYILKNHKRYIPKLEEIPDGQHERGEDYFNEDGSLNQVRYRQLLLEERNGGYHWLNDRELTAYADMLSNEGTPCVIDVFNQVISSNSSDQYLARHRQQPGARNVQLPGVRRLAILRVGNNHYKPIRQQAALSVVPADDDSSENT